MSSSAKTIADSPLLPIMVVLLAGSGAHGQMSLVSQSRSVSVAGACGNGSDSAPSFGPWGATVFAGNNSASQTSTVSETLISGSGGTVRGGPGGSCSGVSGGSSLSATFTLAQPVSFSITMFATSTSGFYGVGLTGPNTNISFNRAIQMPQTVSGVLQPGSYSVSASSYGGPEIGTLGPSQWSLDFTVAYCRSDFNTVGGVTVQDVFDFLAAWFANDPRADFNGVGGITAQDVFDFLAAWFAGC